MLIHRSVLVTVAAPDAFAVVADVERYAEFLPGCEAVEVLSKTPADAAMAAEQTVEARVTARTPGGRVEFVTRNRQQAPQTIALTLVSGPIQELNGEWHFQPRGDAGCRIDLRLQIDGGGWLMRLLKKAAEKAADQMVDAFVREIEARAEAS